MSTEDYKQYLISSLDNYKEQLKYIDAENISDDSYVFHKTTPISDNKYEITFKIEINFLEG